MPLLEVKDLRTYFFTRWGVGKAVDGVNFHLEEQESLGIVGESGCGKSVTALSLLRLVPQPAGRIVGGEIWLDGENLLQKSEKEMRQVRGRKISMILQDPMTSLNPVYSIGWQIVEALRIHGGGSSKRQLWQLAKEALQMVRIADPEERLRVYPHQMSGGMRQRVVGAIALSCQPHLLIADEATTSLDATIQAQYLALLREVQEKANVALIFITHDMGIVAHMCDRVAVMYAGRIVETATTREIFNHPLHPYTEALLGSVPSIEKRVERLYSIEGQPPDVTQLLPGCSFAPRCVARHEKCLEFPPEVEVRDGHWVSCWKYA